MADAFPTTAAELNFRDETVFPRSLYRSMRDLRKATLSIPNKLRSILQDAEFVQHVVTEQSPEGSKLPLIANERCGSWYIPPDRKAGSAYFKSTDGHFGQWDFSLRRLNLQVLSIVGKYGGAIIVDSTRRGKSMPDAFAKTVPIWVVVMNIVLFPDVPESHTFQQPPEPYGLGDSEVSQIEKRLDGFVKALKSLNLDLQGLRQELDRPMKLSWRVND
jgi:tRNA A64-2'-O-ribosylphosphate transferase